MSVKVKQIVWGSTSYDTPEAATVVGTYRIVSAMNGGWTVTLGREVLRDTDGRTNFATLTNAKATAQEHFEGRVRSALE